MIGQCEIFLKSDNILQLTVEVTAIIAACLASYVLMTNLLRWSIHYCYCQVSNAADDDSEYRFRVFEVSLIRKSGWCIRMVQKE